MAHRQSILWACAIAAGTSTSYADNFTWFAGNGLWENPALWNGPIGQYPDSILDTATISGANSEATLDQNLAVGTLNVINGASVMSSGNSVFVNADATISGGSANLSVTQSISLRDFDADTLTVTGGYLFMNGGLAQFDEALILNHNGTILGAGSIEMNSTTGNLEFNNAGLIWASGTPSIGDTLLITRTDSSTSKLDWTAPQTQIVVSEATTLRNELPYSGSLGGYVSVTNFDGDTRFESTSPIVAGVSSKLLFSGPNFADIASIEAPVIDSYGRVSTSTRAQLDTPLLALRGEVVIAENASLAMNASIITFDSLEISSPGDNARLQMSSQPNSVLNIINGETSVVMGAGSRFDLDGSGDKTVNIADDSSLWLEVEAVDTSLNSIFGGTLNIDGTLHVESVGLGPSWRSTGEIALDSGTISGRRLDNDGVIRGKGYIDAYTVNGGSIIAEGGTLELRSVRLDGVHTPATGELYAETGDLVMNMQSPAALQYFTGSIHVGDGVGIREVLQTNNDLVIRQEDGVTGSMSLNGGFVILHDFTQRGLLSVQGVSQIRTTGVNSEDAIAFSSPGVNTIAGELEVDGKTWFSSGAEFTGEGLINAVSTVKSTTFQDGADLGDVLFRSAGNVQISDAASSGRATMGGFALADTATLEIDLGDLLEPFSSDQLTAHDTVTLAGELELDWNGQAPPPIGETTTIIQAGTIIGEFGSIDASSFGANRRVSVTVGENSVDVFVTCAADLTGDGQNNFFDLVEFLTLLNAMDPAADLDENGQFNFFDLSMYLDLFNLGC